MLTTIQLKNKRITKRIHKSVKDAVRYFNSQEKCVLLDGETPICFNSPAFYALVYDLINKLKNA